MLNLRRVPASALVRRGLARSLATAATTTSSSSLRPGDALHGFNVQRTISVPELQIDVTELAHAATGAKYTHFARNDSNNVFAVGFRTPVSDSTGVPHILEHSTLCGSERYPVRDPFFKMLQRSLSTYMNAWTAEDYTLYPFSTQNATDYRNLMSVYMDAVFQPKLDRMDFMQEGWRLEHRDTADPASPIEFKGVVYNEMKGMMASIHYHFYQALHRHLFEGSVYAPNSGGDPRNITDLTWEQLRNFHRTYYSPANARFFSYGNFDLAGTLAYVNETLAALPKDKIGTPLDAAKIADLPNITQPKVVHETCAFDPMGDPAKQTRFCVSYGCCDVRDVYTSSALGILSKLLMDGSSSPMQQALIDSGLAPDYSPVSGYDGSTRKSSFTIGVQGISSDQITAVEQAIATVLASVARDGFPAERVDAVIHQMELGVRHVTSDFGMNLLTNVSSGLFQGVDTAAALEITKTLARLREDARNGLFQRLVQTYLLNNNHRVTLTMSPDEAYPASLAAEETARLARHVDALTAADRKRILDEGIALAKAQDSKSDVSVLPCLTLDEVPHATPYHPIETTAAPAVGTVVTRQADTNGITYLRASADLSALPEDLLPYLPLFASALTWQGTHAKPMEVLDQELRLYTGGIGMAPQVVSSLDGTDAHRVRFGVSGNALNKNLDRLSQLMAELTFESKLDRTDRLRTLVAGKLSSMSNSLAMQGHSYAMTLAASQLVASRALSEKWSGISQLQLLNEIAKGDIESVVPKLEAILDHVKRAQTKYMVVAQPTTVAQAIESLAPMASAKLATTQADTAATTANAWSATSGTRTFVPAPFPVNYCAMALPTVPFASARDSMALTVAGTLATHRFLHREIREKGGAYGGGASHSAMDGTFLLYSYRDPRSLATVDDFDRALAWLAQGGGAITAQDMLEAKLGIFSSMDAPVDVGSQGAVEFSHGVSRELRQARRDALFAVTVDDIARVAREILVAGSPNAARVVVGNAEATKDMEKAGWTVKALDV
ncbi:Mitochondrial presequence protease [Blastocladiella emersonii ATCC 22665]|nr:Mitochondrial presequence protease [Blastocladiella emersonii ATCC 22665]